MNSSSGVSPATWTHQAYFRRFKLSVEQYGEILVADLFSGDKKGDAQPCFDVEAKTTIVRSRLVGAGIPISAVDICLAIAEESVRVEVKSKLARTPTGVASVIHCNDNKFNGARRHLAATHFAVILFDLDGKAERAWLLPTIVAAKLRREDTKSKYIPVKALSEASNDATRGIVNVCALINEVASGVLYGG